VFTECDFGGADLGESVHHGSAFRSCRFLRTVLLAHSATPVSLGSTFEDCRLRPIVFDEVDFTLAVLGGADLRGVDLSGCRLRETGLVGPTCARRCCVGRTCPARAPTACAWSRPTYAAPHRRHVVDDGGLPRRAHRRRAGAGHAVAHGLDVSGD
jgi:hypothetical protein